MPVDAVAVLRNLIEDILHNRDAAAQYAADPTGTLAAQGVTEGDLSGVDMRQLVGDVCGSPEISADTRSALQSYTSGGSGSGSSGGYSAPPPSSGGTSVDHVVQHLNYVTYTTYKDDHSITQTILDSSTHVDNSTNLDVSGDVHGNIDVDTDNATAVGDGAVAGNAEDGDVNAATALGDGSIANSGFGDVTSASGEGSVAASTGFGDVNAATGDGAQVIDGDNFGQANTGDGAVQVGGANSGAVNTGVNTGIVAGDDVDSAVVGDGNQTAQVDGDTDGSVFDFGSGDVSNINDSDVRDSAVSAGGDAANTSNNTADHGSAISGSGGGDARGSFEDNDQDNDQDNDTTLIEDNDTTTTTTDIDTHVETTDIDAHDSAVNTEQGPGDAHQDADTDLHAGHEFHPSEVGL